MGDVVIRVQDARTRDAVEEFSIGTDLTGSRDYAAMAYIRRQGMQTVVDEGGEWKKSMKAGAPMMLVEADGYAPYLARLDVTPGDEGATDHVAALVPESVVNLQVRDASGNPVSMASVYVDYYQRDPHPTAQHMYQTVGHTDAQGALRVGKLTEGAHTLIVDHADYAVTWYDVALRSETTHDERITLTKGASVYGRVTMDGEPVLQGWVMLQYGDRDDWNRRMGERTNDDGEFTIDGLMGGSAIFTVAWRDPNDAYFNRSDEMSVTIPVGEILHIDRAMLSGTGALEGTFLVNGERNMRNMYIHVQYSAQDTMYQMSARREDGILGAHSMPAGAAVIEAHFTDPETLEEYIEYFETEIRDGETTLLDIDIDYPDSP